MPLKNDVGRCHDENCLERFTCARWIERDGGDGDNISHYASLYSWGDFPLPLPCGNKIEQEVK
jgi:hypothetical protein